MKNFANGAAAVWFDADSSGRKNGRVFFADGVLRATDDGDERREAALAEVNISPRLGNVPRRIIFADGTTLTVDDNDFVDAILATEKRGGAANWIHLAESRRRLIVAMAAAATLAVFVFINSGIPKISAVIAAQVSPQQLTTISDSVYEQIKKHGLLQDSRLSEKQKMRLQKLFAAVVQDVDGDEKIYRYRLLTHRFGATFFNRGRQSDNSKSDNSGDEKNAPLDSDSNSDSNSESVVDDDSDAQNNDESKNDSAAASESGNDSGDGFANAFALPDGLIIATDKLAKILDDDEIAAVFAHEIGHIENRHGVRSWLQSLGVFAFLTLASGDISGVLAGGVLLINLQYSRDFERQADCFGYRYLKQKNLPPSLIGQALTKMEKNTAAAFAKSGDDSDAAESEKLKESESAKSELKESDGDDSLSENKLKESDDGDSLPENKKRDILADILQSLSTHPSTKERFNLAASCDE